MEKEVRVGVAVIIARNKVDGNLTDDSEILIGKRKGSHGEGIYSVPGGHLEFGETYEQCCSRELEEEIGVSFNSYTPISFSEDYFKSEEHYSFDKHYTTLYFLANSVDDEIIIKNLEPEKCESWEWVKIKDLSDEMFCDTYEVIQGLVFPF